MGVAALCLAKLGSRKQRDPLKAAWVVALETAVVSAPDGALSLEEAEMAGFLLFCAHSRSRCSDASRIVHEPFLDESAGPGAAEASFIETHVVGSSTKSGNTAKKARLDIPVVGLSYGLSDMPWGFSWLEIRSQLGLDATLDGCLQRDLLASGTFGEGRLKPGQATEWLRFLLLKLDVESSELKNVGSHSCKATFLSMAAKAGLDRDVRRTLGGHAPPNDKSVDIYSRDSLSAPLRDLAKLFTSMRNDEFDPDASRSGRWAKVPAPGAANSSASIVCSECHESVVGKSAFICDCGSWAHSSISCIFSCERCPQKFCRHCDHPNTHLCSSDTASLPTWVEDFDAGATQSENDSDLEEARMIGEAEEAEVQDVEDQRSFLTKGFSSGADAAMPAEGVLIHNVYKTAHKATEELGAACGVRTNGLCFDFSDSSDELSECQLCWRIGCAPWLQAQTELGDDASVRSEPHSPI